MRIDEYSRIFENTGDGVWAVDADQRIVLWNRAAEELLGHTAEEALGQFCYELLAGRDLGGRPVCQAQCCISECARRGGPIHSFNLRVQCSNNQIAWIDVSGIVIPDESATEDYGVLVHLFRCIHRNGTPIPPLSIRLLGPVLVQRPDGTPVEGAFQRRAKIRALFSILALHRGQAVRRDLLQTTLWPDMSRESAFHNLNTTVYLLRHSLEPNLRRGPDSTYIQTLGDCYLLMGGRTHWLDVDAFENKLAAAHHMASPGRAERLYREAIALSRGAFLADLDAYQLDCWSERERYRQLYLDALQRLGDVLLGQNQEDEAMTMYHKVLTEDPCREAAARKLMRLALQHGERTRVLSQYAWLEENLERELGIEPSEETRRLRQEARSQG